MTTTTKTILSIFVTDLEAYNAGHLRGEWLELPADPGEIEECIDRITGGEDHEIFITDYESDIGIECSEYSNIDELNELAETFADLNEFDQNIVEALIECGACSGIAAAVDRVSDCVLYSECETLVDLAYVLVDEGLFGDIPKGIENYIDYEAIARDLNYDSYYETSYGVLQTN